MRPPLPSLAQVAAALGGEVRGLEVFAPGPGHSGADRSLAVKLDAAAPDGFMVYSFSGDDAIASKNYVRQKLGLRPFEPNGNASGGRKSWPLLSEHIYRDEHGEPYLRVRRFLDHNGKKQYPQYHWANGTWAKNAPKGPRLPYRLPELIAAPPGTTVLVPEGEKCVDALIKLGFVATCNPGGADPGSGKKWTSDLNKWFAGRTVVVLVDNDRPGRRHAEHVAKQLHAVADTVRVLDLAKHWPGAPMQEGYDVYEWLEQHDRAGSRLAQLAKEAPLWIASSAEGSDAASDREPSTDDEEIIRLAKLSTVEYERERKNAAKRLNVRASILDRLVQAERPDHDAGKRRRAISFPEYEPWPESVDGNALLLAVKAHIGLHIAADDATITTAALWVAFAWAHDAYVHSPILVISSKEPNSGKTTFVELIKFMVPRGISSIEITPAALYRAIEQWQPTLLVDEADVIFKQRDDLRAVFNSGWTRGQGIIRCNPDTLDPEVFPTFAPKVIGMKGLKLPETTLGRSIVLVLKRKLRTEVVEDFDHQDSARLRQLRAQLARWTADNIDALRNARPDLPDGFHNRLACNWRPLFAVADLCGGGWPARARAAARALTKEEPTSRYVEALAAIKAMFDARAAEVAADRMFSEDIVSELLAIEDGPWRSYGGKNRDKPITQQNLATLLHPIRPTTVRIGTKTLKGYYRRDFDDAFGRYLDPAQHDFGPTPQNLPSRRHEVDEIDVASTFDPSQPKSVVTDPNWQKPNTHAVCDAVTDENRGTREDAPIERWRGTA
jgi:putative DNA primase/helicase